MCRHLAYVGAPVSLADLLVTPELGLLRQSWDPQEQSHGVVNADGFGVGWYADHDPTPARYRRAVPMWTDTSFLDVARVTSSRAVLAAVRSATVGTSLDESAVAPYREGRWLFSHNGRVDGWPDAVTSLAADLPASRLLALESRVDSALLWALTLERLAASDPLERAVARVVADVRSVTTGRLNLLVTDGTRIVATAAGDTLYWRSTGLGIVVSSEPSDRLPGWNRVPDGSLLTATRGHVDVAALSSLEKETQPS